MLIIHWQSLPKEAEMSEQIFVTIQLVCFQEHWAWIFLATQSSIVFLYSSYIHY